MTGRSRLPDGRIPVLLSAHRENLIGRDAAAILRYLHGRYPSAAAINVPDVAATVHSTRRIRRHRAVVRAGDGAELTGALAALAADAEHPLVARSSNAAAVRTAFVLPGQGGQWPGMGADAYRALPAYRAEVTRCAAAFTAAGHLAPLPYLLGDSGRSWPQIQIQGAQFAHAVGLARVWRDCGILPDLTVGHSLGEVAAAYLAHAVPLRDAIAVLAARAGVVDRLPGRYAMAVLGRDAAGAAALIAEIPGALEIAVVNGPSSTAVSGERTAVRALARHAADRGIFVREIAVDFPAHTSALAPLRTALHRLLPAARFADTATEFIGSTHGGPVQPGTDFRGYWYDNLRNTVRFDAAISAAVRAGGGVFVELSAHPSLLYSISELAGDAVAVGSGRRDHSVVDQLSAGIVAAAVSDPHHRWVEGAAAAGAGFDRRRALPEFPNAPMHNVHLWAAPEPLPAPAVSGPVVAFEQWQPTTVARARRSAPRRLALIGGDDALRRRLRTAAAAHPGVVLTSIADADLAVLIAPVRRDRDPAVAIAEIVAGTARPDYRAVPQSPCRRVWLLTTAGERVDATDAVALPIPAALAAMHRCAGLEDPDRSFAHLDLPDRDIDAGSAGVVIDILLGADTEVALRPGNTGDGRAQCFRRVLRVPDEPAPSLDPRFADDLSDVVITGGSGAIGLRYARHCIERGAERVTLLSRTGVEPDVLAGLAAGYPTQLHAPRCDITDAAAVERAAADHGGAGATLVIHAAGLARFGPHDQPRSADLTAMLDAKVLGLARLTGRWPQRPHCRILLCSSISGVWGGAGHAGYAAANRLLDVFADQLRADGQDCTALRWGLWPHTGLVGADEIERIQRCGLLPMDPDGAVGAGLHRYRDDPLIFTADFDRLRIFLETQGVPVQFDQIAAPAAPPSADPGDRPVTEVVRDALATVLCLTEPETIDLDAALVVLGVDSLLALDLRNRLRRATGRAVPLANLLGGGTAADLIDQLTAAGKTGD